MNLEQTVGIKLTVFISMGMTNVNDLFGTSDWVLVAALSYLGFRIDAVENNPKGRSIFYIQRIEGLEESIERFWRRELLVEPQELNQHMKLVKARMYDGR